MSFHQKSVENLRKMLIDSGKYSLEEVQNIKGKANLVEAIMSLNKESNSAIELLDSVEIIDDSFQSNDEEVDEVQPPNYYSHDWHNYVMSHFQEDELVNGFPKIDGLRRVAELLLGDIIETGPTKLESSGQHAFCVYQIRFDWKMSEGHYKVFTASGGSSKENTDDLFSIYPECIAETRAEARALRRALKIRIAAADEIKNVKMAKQPQVTSSTGEWSENELISSTQRKFLEKKCAQLEIDLMKFVNNGKSKYNSVDEVTKDTATKMITAINLYQQNIEQIPPLLKIVKEKYENKA